MFEHTRKPKEKLIRWFVNEGVSRGKEMSTSLDTEYNGMNVIGEKKRKVFLMNLLVGSSDDFDTLKLM